MKPTTDRFLESQLAQSDYIYKCVVTHYTQGDIYD